MGNSGRSYLHALAFLFVVVGGFLPLVSAAPTISVNPTSGTIYSNYIVSGSGFSSSSQAQVYFNNTEQTPSGCSEGTYTYGLPIFNTTSSGSFICTFSVPSQGTRGGGAYSISPGSYKLFGYDQHMAIQSATQSFTVTAPSGIPSIQLTPNNGTVGVYPMVGSNFTYSGPTSDPVTPYFNGVAISCAYGTDYVLGDGSFYCDFNVPNLPPGSYNVTVSTPDNKLGTVANQKFTINGASSSTTTSSSISSSSSVSTSTSTTIASSTTTVPSTTTSSSTTTIYSNAPQITVTPNQVPVGQSYYVTGINFDPQAIVSFHLSGNGLHRPFYPSPIGGRDCRLANIAYQSFENTTYVDQVGSFNCTFFVSVQSYPEVGAGSYTLTANELPSAYYPGLVANATLNVIVVPPAITVSPSKNYAGSSYYVNGVGFFNVSNSTPSAIAKAQVYLSNLTSNGIGTIQINSGGRGCFSIIGTQVWVNSTGKFSCKFTLPSNYGAGNYTVTVKGLGSNYRANATLNIIPTAVPLITIARIKARWARHPQ